jgi:DNA ligase (NAD+)
MDGLVIGVDRPYTRNSDKNPDYAKAYKEALECNIAVTTVRKIEWNVSQYGYLAPTIVYDPVTVGGFLLTRATGHNAKNIVDLGLGPGAKVEVIHHGSVNPQIYKVLTPVAPDMPTVPYVWVESSSGEPCYIKFDETATDEESSDSAAIMSRAIQIKKIHKFLSEIEAKGIGETTVAKIYDHLIAGEDYSTHSDVISKFIHLTVDDVAFLGATISKNIVSAIGTAMSRLTIPKLMSSSKVFGRGLGARKFSKVLQKYPDLISERLTQEEYVKIFRSVDGFGQKTAELAAEGMGAFWDYIYEVIPEDTVVQILSNTKDATDGVDEASANPEIKGKNIYLTGFRDDKISEFITSNGGTLQSGCTGSTHILVRKNSDYSNKKTEFAEAHGITIMDRAEFTAKFLS